MDVPKPKEIIVPVDHADKDDESGLVFDEDNNTINDPEVGDSQVTIRYARRKSCFKAGFGGSIFCKYHLSKWKDQTSPDSELPPLQILRKHLSSFLQVKWTDEPAMGNVLALMDSIYTGKMPTSALSFIDLEFNSYGEGSRNRHMRCSWKYDYGLLDFIWSRGFRSNCSKWGLRRIGLGIASYYGLVLEKTTPFGYFQQQGSLNYTYSMGPTG
ncbi:hypothetical protein CHU98_g12317 [Xylaria longipes]|nr:hypothetical protein CHU98_g12317 [Xylaria longipes]